MSGVDVKVGTSEVEYPTSDGLPMAETEVHVLFMVGLIGTLRSWVKRWKDVYVVGNIFLYFEEGNPDARRSPDVMVVKGLIRGCSGPRSRRGKEVQRRAWSSS